MPTTKYDTHSDSDSDSADDYDNIEVRFGSEASVHGEFTRVFGTESQYGQSLGVNMNASLDDGLLFYYPSKRRYKVFSWKAVAGYHAAEAVDRGIEVSLDDGPFEPDMVETESYGSGTQTYELLAARIPEVTDDGETVVEPQSMVRDIESHPDGGNPSYTDFERLDGERPDIGNIITWYTADDEYGPSTTSKRMLEVLSVYGSDSVVDENDAHNWLPDTSGDNIMREDLQNRKVEYFRVTRDGDEYNYVMPVIIDLSTGEEIGPTNVAHDGGGSGNDGTASDDTESDAVQEARAADAGEHPEPVADFIRSGTSLNLNEDRAGNLLDELLADPENSLTEGMVEDSGGRAALIDAVTA
jgi:hypothetical protein